MCFESLVPQTLSMDDGSMTTDDRLRVVYCVHWELLEYGSMHGRECSWEGWLPKYRLGSLPFCFLLCHVRLDHQPFSSDTKLQSLPGLVPWTSKAMSPDNLFSFLNSSSQVFYIVTKSRRWRSFLPHYSYGSCLAHSGFYAGCSSEDCADYPIPITPFTKIPSLPCPIFPS